jgi:2-polyprenyl-3-methyl-5-hydroxy-6-metoxy-1,4-benzoquinol methylase
MHTTTAFKCEVCSSKNIKKVSTIISEIDGACYSACVCNDCKLFFVNPKKELKFSDLQNIYGTAYTEGQRKIASDDAENRLMNLATHKQMEIVEKHIPKGLALNVGAMSHASRILEERGWKLHVVEVSKYAAETAKKLWGDEITISRIEDFEYPAESFNFIKLGHVIEHLAYPKLVINKLAKMLKKNGGILIDTDNAYGIVSQLEMNIRKVIPEKLTYTIIKKLTNKNINKRYGSLMPPIHLYSFSSKNLVKLLKDAGLEIAFVIKPGWGNETWFPVANHLQKSRAEKILTSIERIGEMCGCGDVIAVLAIKK